ncbi:Rhodanese-related sulfurtransferase (fragment) [Candidatus Terasakiella magnetica]
MAAGITKVSAPEIYDLTQSGGTVLIDVRQPEEWKQTGVPEGARLISMRHPEGGAGFLRDVRSAVGGDANRPIAIICRTGNRSAAVSRALSDAGFTHIFDVSEGMAGSGDGPGWIKRGLPTKSCASC